MSSAAQFSGKIGDDLHPNLISSSGSNQSSLSSSVSIPINNNNNNNNILNTSSSSSLLSPSSDNNNNNNNNLVGGISTSSSPHHHDTNTLDEPVTETIMRDVRQIATKIKHVLMPTNSTKELRDWDLWGPLILCLVLACSLSFTSPHDQTALIFAAVFVIVWCGAGIVTLNAALLGGNISFLQSVCVLGYCLAPLSLSSIVAHAWYNLWYRFFLVITAFLWSTKASVGFMAQLVQDNRKALAVYPVLLFYLTISWMILVQ